MAHRKLQQEVDRVFKKISEGMDSFNESYDRHEMSTNQTQRDKLESDLKKEIKKLQRLREQIKVWQTSNEVKDKDTLLKYRHLVESAMERYKQVERDSKTKAYSKEGLSQPEQLSPEEKAKQDTIEYVKDVLDQMQIQTEGIEAEIAKLSISGRKAKKGGMGPKDQERKSELDDSMDMFKLHQENLELVLRLLQNGKLEPDSLGELKEDIQYFLENNQDPDFMFDDSIYESLGLDERDQVLAHDVKSAFDIINGDSNNKEETQTDHNSSSSISHSNGKNSMVKRSISPASPPITKKIPTSSSSSSSSTTIKTTGTLHSSTFLTSLPPSATSLKPAPLPSRPVNEKKWADAAATSASKLEQKQSPTSIPSKTTISLSKPPIIGELNIIPQNAPTSSSSSSSSSPKITSQNSKLLSDTATSDPKSTAPAMLSTATTDTIITSQLDKIVTKQEQEPLSPNEIKLTKDPLVASLTPGMQSFVYSFIQVRNDNKRKKQSETPSAVNYGTISSCKDLMVNPRKDLVLGLNLTLHPNEILKLSSEWDAFRSTFNYDFSKNPIKIIDLDLILSKADPLILFFGFYYGLSESERNIAKRGLFLKNWRLYKNQAFWFLKAAPSSSSGENFEVSNYEVFDAGNWSVKVLTNYQLDLTQLTPVDL
ncbi:CCR4-NOT core subunit [Saccharomycopsis crataegensis]|uniref:General negative regulator of transcription subunit n=1 Tax=Saccharomycopsis crataegensis TaxID=43959 RepID=A0AAV5QPQ1_9ASCO|nr:CCR4-NOT core subunit [Saccharomycopsis crataegensis]